MALAPLRQPSYFAATLAYVRRTAIGVKTPFANLVSPENRYGTSEAGESASYGEPQLNQ